MFITGYMAGIVVMGICFIVITNYEDDHPKAKYYAHGAPKSRVTTQMQGGGYQPIEGPIPEPPHCGSNVKRQVQTYDVTINCQDLYSTDEVLELIKRARNPAELTYAISKGPYQKQLIHPNERVC